MRLHLDPVGGIAGDMFVAALTDAFPELTAPAIANIALLEPEVAASCRVEPHQGAVLAGARFRVDLPPAAGHGHTSWATIRGRLTAAALEDSVRSHALALFGLLAEAEAAVHGVAADDVTFHEVGARDSVADILAAATIAAALDAEAWTTAPPPLGSGRVRTAHGPMPVPAPATAWLLRGFPTIDDGVPGERVTPTGAAILRHLVRPGRPPPGPGVLVRSGTGFGARTLPGIGNYLRVLAFDTNDAGVPDHPGRGVGEPLTRELLVVEFEVDDQTAEDLATGLDRLRAARGVIDVVQTPVVGKKGRVMAHVRVLAVPAECPGVVAACFRETTTIGLRHRITAGAVLARRTVEADLDGRPLRVKLVERPGVGVTAKAEADDLAGIGRDHAARARARAAAERLALARDDGNDEDGNGGR